MSGQPVGHRIQSLDILRGLALLGMFVVHVHERTTEPGGVDDLVRTAVWRLVESKSHGTFALLFGAGFAIMLRRADAAGRPFVSVYLRRLAVLALFGFAAHLLCGFNVLLGYAAWGVPLLAIRRWPTRALVVIAVLCTISSPVYHLLNEQRVLRSAGVAAARAEADARAAERNAVNAGVKAAAQQSEYRVLLAARLSHMAWFHRQPFFFLPGATLALFIVGLLLVRHSVFEDPLAHRGVLAGLGAFGLVSWLAGNWLTPSVGLVLRDQWLTFTYVSGALAVLAWRPSIADRLRGVAMAGRMALTNYLLQIALLDLLFAGYAVGLGRIRPVWGLIAAVGGFVAEVAFSTVWLSRFRFGPAEWLWRSLTYGRWQPWRAATPEP